MRPISREEANVGDVLTWTSESCTVVILVLDKRSCPDPLLCVCLHTSLEGTFNSWPVGEPTWTDLLHGWERSTWAEQST